MDAVLSPRHAGAEREARWTVVCAVGVLPPVRPVRALHHGRVLPFRGHDHEPRRHAKTGRARGGPARVRRRARALQAVRIPETAGRPPLLDLQSVYLVYGSPLPLGEQLCWRVQSETLRTVSHLQRDVLRLRGYHAFLRRRDVCGNDPALLPRHALHAVFGRHLPRSD